MHSAFLRPAFGTAALLFGTLSLTSCSVEEEQPPAVLLHLFNPFGLDGIPAEASGHTPYFHGEFNNFGLTKMDAEGSCGWFTVQLNEAPGEFRFYGSDWNGPEWGEAGLGSQSNFNQDALFGSNNDVYAVPDLATGFTSFSSQQPFECDSSTVMGAENPFTTGALPSNAQAAHANDLYRIWLDNYYVEQGDQARIAFDNAGETVSEGIGYGMLIFVYADDADAQSRFDKLLAYKKAWTSSSGLMDWRITGFSAVASGGGATDADLDIATALILASRKWADSSYLTEAQTIIDAIRTNAFEPGGYLKSGDLWQDGEALNPSYFSFVAFQLFSEVDTANASFWQEAISRHYTLITGGRHTTTGLIANWTNSSGIAQQPPATTPYNGWANYGFDAIRVPWRAAWAALWYGSQPAHSPAAGIANTICSFSASGTGGDPASLNAEYSLEGSPFGGSAGGGVIGTFATACMLDPSNTAFLNAAYNLMRTKTASYDLTYYQSSLQVLTALLLSGEMVPY